MADGAPTIRQELLARLEPEANKPEGRVRRAWIERLVSTYGYDSRQIDIEVSAGAGRAANHPASAVRADIVVYRDRERTEPLIVIETKPPAAREGVPQAESYARNLWAEYFVWSDGTVDEFYRTSRYGGKSERTGNIPHWVGQRAAIEKLPKSAVLPPFRNEAELRGIVQACHNLIWEKEGHDPAKAFDELTKLLFLKLYDEREVPDRYEFMVYADETVTETAGRLRALFVQATSERGRYRDVFINRSGEPVATRIDLDDQTLVRVVTLLQGYSLVNTTESINGADIKGTVFEQMVGSTFRGELGQFFTPRQLVEFMIRFLNPKPTDRIYDPTCGSAGLLIMAIKFMRERIAQEQPNLNDVGINARVHEFAQNNLFGTDINERIARVAKMNMIMHGDGHAGIFNSNGLVLDAAVPQRAKDEIRPNQFDIIVSNPPFAGFEKDAGVLTRFDLGKNTKGTPRAVTREVLFIERIVRLLAPGGRAAIVLPQGIFSDRGLGYVRSFIRQHCMVLAVVGMPDWAFIPSGTSVRGSILFLEKREPPPADYKVFFRQAEQIGYTTTGQEDLRTDLDTILREYKEGDPEHFVPIAEVGDRLDAKLYTAQARALMALFSPGGGRFPYQRLGDIVQVSPERVTRSTLGDGNIRYVEVGDIDGPSETLDPKTIRAKDAKYSSILRLRTGDIVLSRRRPYLGAIVLVRPEWDGCFTIPECSVLRIADEALRSYVYELIRSQPFLDLMTLYSTGEMSTRLAEDDLKDIQIPVPSPSELGALAKQIQDSTSRLERLTQEAIEVKESKARIVLAAFSTDEEAAPVFTKADFMDALRRVSRRVEKPESGGAS